MTNKQSSPVPMYDTYLSNNDYTRDGSTPDEVFEDIGWEMRIKSIPAIVIIRHDLSKDTALKEIDNLRSLVEKAYPLND